MTRPWEFSFVKRQVPHAASSPRRMCAAIERLRSAEQPVAVHRYTKRSLRCVVDLTRFAQDRTAVTDHAPNDAVAISTSVAPPHRDSSGKPVGTGRTVLSSPRGPIEFARKERTGGKTPWETVTRRIVAGAARVRHCWRRRAGDETVPPSDVAKLKQQEIAIFRRRRPPHVRHATRTTVRGGHRQGRKPLDKNPLKDARVRRRCRDDNVPRSSTA